MMKFHAMIEFGVGEDVGQREVDIEALNMLEAVVRLTATLGFQEEITFIQEDC